MKLKRRSKTQVEFNASYPLDVEQRKTTHAVDAYLFVPRSLGINQKTYPGYLFYRDLLLYSELMPKQQTLSQMLDSDGGLLALMYEKSDEARENPEKKGKKSKRRRCRSLKARREPFADFLNQQSIPNCRRRWNCAAGMSRFPLQSSLWH